jgi:TadE-like protein
MSRRRGQALVEFALVVPVLFLLFLGIVETGRLVFYLHTLNNAAREGARYAIVHGENALGGCPSGPLAPTSSLTACDPSGDRVRGVIIGAATSLDTSGLNFGYPGDGGFPLYWYPDANCTSPTDPGCPGSSKNNARGNSVTVRLQYSYSPIMLLDAFGSITINAETTLVINN